MSVQTPGNGGGAGHIAPPPDGHAESDRLDVLRRYALLDTPPDPTLDRITAMAARLFDTPVAAISLVDEDRVWFKSRIGLDTEEIKRPSAPCHFASQRDAPMIVPDAHEDERLTDNAMLAGGISVRFYAAAPLTAPGGHVLGTLCVADVTPRTTDPGLQNHLADLAALAMDLLLRTAGGNGHKDATIRDRDATISERDETIRDRDATIRDRDETIRGHDGEDEDADLIAREVDHRVKNDLQFIASLLSMQARTVPHSEAAEALSSAASRVSAVARVHQHISVGPGAEDIACLDYLRRLCADIAQAMGERIDVEGAECEVPTRKIGKLGMLANELVTNAIKHGDTPVTVHYGPDPDQGGCVLIVSDGGPGLPDGFDPAASEGLGMRVVRSLTQQIDGELEHDNHAEGGAVFRIRFTP